MVLSGRGGMQPSPDEHGWQAVSGKANRLDPGKMKLSKVNISAAQTRESDLSDNHLNTICQTLFGKKNCLRILVLSCYCLMLI